MKTSTAGILASAILLTGVSAHASGLQFVISYSTAVQNDANYANIQSAVQYVENEFSSTYNDPITLHFTVDENSIGLGQSLFSNNYWRGSYTALRAALVADAKTADDATATNTTDLPLSAPYGAVGSTAWYATSAEAKALGLITDQTVFDGTYTFNAAVSYTYDPNNRAVAGEYDFIGVTEHEFSELMGRTTQITNTGFGYDLLDTMRFTAPGTRSIGNSGVYFSFDNGATNLEGYNSGSGDYQDFSGAVATDPYNASTSTDQGHVINSVDIRALDVIGYDLSAPEPSFLIPLAGILFLGLGRLRKRP